MALEGEGYPKCSSNDTEEEENFEISAYKKDACRVITFRLVYKEEDLKSNDVIALTFTPEMAHQVFGESESIFGYRNLSIYLNYLHNSCRCFLDINSRGKLESNTMKPDDIEQILDQWLPKNYTTKEDEFIKWIKEEEHDKIYGEILNTIEKDLKTKYHITKNDIKDKEFTEFHARFETFIIWFIDAANFIDLEDHRWNIFYVYEERDNNKTPVGFCTVYMFYAYPSNIRARVSQFFILPSHQRQGIGTMLYETVSKHLRNMEEVIDITVEEPTPALQRIRDLEDCGILHKTLLENQINFSTASWKKIFDLGRQKKIGKRQMRRVYDILSLFYAHDKGPKASEQVLTGIFNRIIEETERESRPSKRFRNVKGIPQPSGIDKSQQIEQELRNYCEDIDPSVKYLQQKLDNWLKMQ
ncbi:histone acetyltransferase type B catalytic subunit [Anthonomus grandis grandis]|uniref:histone acetyltransferase type B catalytic subunit n=1 Tax=Anthonomus grandis grandis TaxID=2921223 RepID=UPI002166000C|nr:histone acetyltransferase type B catalytic subunit [Anthonomus grandis grandis]